MRVLAYIFAFMIILASAARLAVAESAAPISVDPKLEKILSSAFEKVVGHPFKTKNTRHFILVYDTPEEFASHCATQVEASHDAFMKCYANAAPAPLQRRLVVLLFAKRSDFQIYAKTADASELPLAGGYYSSATNFVAFYDDASSAEASKLELALASSLQKSESLAKQIEEAAKHGQTGLVNALSAERKRIDLWVEANRADFRAHASKQNAAKTMHEAAHQMSFNTGLQSRSVEYPLWLSEGIATQFETPDKNGNPDLMAINSGRLAAFNQAKQEKALLPLEKLIAENPPANIDNKAMNVWYAQSWAFYRYLRMERPQAAEKILAAYRQIAPLATITAERRKSIVTGALDESLDSLEKKYLAYTAKLSDR